MNKTDSNTVNQNETLHVPRSPDSLYHICFESFIEKSVKSTMRDEILVQQRVNDEAQE